MITKVLKAKPNDDFTLDLIFNNGSEKRFDIRPYLNYELFQNLKDLNYFKDIKIVFGSVQWADEQDISPDTLYFEGIDIKGALAA